MPFEKEWIHLAIHPELRYKDTAINAQQHSQILTLWPQLKSQIRAALKKHAPSLLED